MKTLARLCALLLLVLATAQVAAARAPDGVYTGKTADRRAVRFLVWGGGTRVGEFTFGRLPTACGAFDAFAAQAIRVRRGRFSGSYEIPSGSEFVSARGRLSSRGRARGTVGTTSRSDCQNTQARWTASRQPALGPSRRLEAGPALAGSGAAWGEGPGSPRSAPRKPSLKRIPGRRWTVRLGGGRLAGAWLRPRTVFSLPVSLAPFAGLSGSRQALAFAAGGRAYAGDALGGRPRRLPAQAVTPSADGSRVLYVVPRTGSTPGEIRIRDVAAVPGPPDRVVARHTLDLIEGVRLAGDWVAVNVGLRSFVFSTASPMPPWLDESTLPGGAAYAADVSPVGGFDLASDGKLAATRPLSRPGCRRCFAIDWYSPAEPAAHRLLAPPGARPEVAIANDRIAYIRRDSGLTYIQVTTLDGRERTIAVFSRSRSVRHELIGGLDFDGERLAFASRTSRRVGRRWRAGRVRIELVELSEVER